MRILVYILGSIGDSIVTLPALAAIRRHYGYGSHVEIIHERRPGGLSPREVLGAQEGIQGFCEYGVSTSRIGRLWTFLKLALRLKRKKYDMVVYLAPAERRADQVKRDKAFFTLSGIPRRVGFHAFSTAELYPVDSDGCALRTPHEAWFRLRRLELDGVDISQEEDLSSVRLALPEAAVRKVNAWVKPLRKQSSRKIIALSVGSNQLAKLWKTDSFVELGRRLKALGQYELVIVGGRDERRSAEGLIERWGEGMNACGEFSVVETAALLKECCVMIGLDTGPTHLAAAVGVPCVAIYAARDNPGLWDPMGMGHVVLRRAPKCAPCRLINAPCPVKGHPCMSDVTVDEVWEAFLRVRNCVYS